MSLITILISEQRKTSRILVFQKLFISAEQKQYSNPKNVCWNLTNPIYASDNLKHQRIIMYEEDEAVKMEYEKELRKEFFLAF